MSKYLAYWTTTIRRYTRGRTSETSENDKIIMIVIIITICYNDCAFWTRPSSNSRKNSEHKLLHFVYFTRLAGENRPATVSRVKRGLSFRLDHGCSGPREYFMNNVTLPDSNCVQLTAVRAVTMIRLKAWRNSRNNSFWTQGYKTKMCKNPISTWI